MDQHKRLFLAIALSFGLTLLYTHFVWKPQAEAEAAAARADAGAPAAGEGLTPVVAATDADGGAVDAAPPPAVELPLRELKLERQTSTYTFTSDGAGLTSAVLKGRREREEQALTVVEGYQKLFGKQFDPPPQMDLARPIPGVAPQLAVSIAGAHPLPATKRYAVTEEAPNRVVFTTSDGPWEVTKTFSFTDAPPSDKDPTGYVSQLEVTVRNASAQAAAGELKVAVVRAIDPAREQAPSLFGGIGNQASVLCRHGDDVVRKPPNKDEPREEKSGALHFVAIDQQYFLTALWPLSGAVDGRCVLNANETTRTAELVLPLTLGAGESMTRTFGVFMGPKEIDLLQNVGKAPAQPGQTPSGFSPGLEQTIDFGMWAVICKGLLFFLRLFHALTGNWGLAIILLTVLVKVVLLPLTHRAMVSAEQVKKLQPRLEEIRKKYPNDREKQNLEQMKLYQEAGVNPLGGCLPLLLQLPIWAALFTTLRTSYELYGEPFFGVWSDLTTKDPTYLMPLALGVTMIITQRLQPQMSMDKSQAFLMTWVMPIFFTAIMMNYPAGLSLYIFTNNLLSIVQQYALRKYLTARGQLTPAGASK